MMGFPGDPLGKGANNPPAPDDEPKESEPDECDDRGEPAWDEPYRDPREP